ncbi:Sugar kinase (modular protein) [Candidatus Sulfotelmatomonas gaucii]|uniref:Sugar kinase (Modular protein) n=1 Tax=Candidatus Sulfuritelmatomonas gaucii TaxID=2043161 RepID=A0A2N9LL55_9BACT|nr:Sugar kinase (modular protein) [Candidatus Sulfotelmatomonas gaucii]
MLDRSGSLIRFDVDIVIIHRTVVPSGRNIVRRVKPPDQRTYSKQNPREFSRCSIKLFAKTTAHSRHFVIQMITIQAGMRTISAGWESATIMTANLLELCVLAFDVGGSHVASAVCCGQEFHLGPVVSAPHPAAQTSEAFLDLLHELGVKAGATQNGKIGAVLAVPGPFDLQAGVSLMRHKLPYLYGIDLRAALAARFGIEPAQVRFLNDADAYLLGEIGAGAARGFSRVVGLTLGTGIGAAFAVDGRLVTEGPGVPRGGEIWNLPYEGGIVEDFVSARAIAGNYQRRTGVKREVVDLASAVQKDPAAEQAFVEFGRHLGEVIRSLLAGFHADVIVLGGSISRSADLFLPAVRAQMGDSPTQLRVSELKDRAALVGCGVATQQSSEAGTDFNESKSVRAAPV